MAEISVIVPVYNAVKYLQRCVNSIHNQTFIDWECILIDDGSTDNSGILCDEYSNKDFRFHVIHKNNGGVSSARQLGIETAKGDYVIHVDPDDWVEPNMLEDLYNKIVEDDADMVICDFIWNRPSSISILSQCPTALDSRSILKDLFLGRLHGSCCNKLVKKSIIDSNNISFPKELSIHEDMYFITKLVLLDIKVTYLNKAFYHYVIGENANSISQKIGQSYEYDVMVLHMFDKLLEGNECRNYAYIFFATRVITKEFLRRKCSSIEYSKKCIPFVKAIPYIKTNFLRFECAMSLIGFYGIMKRLDLLLRKIRNRWRSYK